MVGRGRHLALGLWVLGALVTTILNLDASVVLLTPLYVRIARRCGLDPLALAFQPVLLSCLASSALPVSNLTNLIAASSRPPASHRLPRPPRPALSGCDRHRLVRLPGRGAARRTDQPGDGRG